MLPVVVPALCTERVLVMRRLVGTPLAEADVSGRDAHELARTLLGAVLRQVVLDGVFHADPHPGNVLLLAAFGLSVPAEVAAVFRALATLEGTLTQLAPGFDLVAEARTFAAGQLTEQWRTSSPRQLVAGELTTLLPMLRRLPRRLERIAGAVEHGRLTVNVRLFADERDRRYATGLLEQPPGGNGDAGPHRPRVPTPRPRSGSRPR